MRGLLLLLFSFFSLKAEQKASIKTTVIDENSIGINITIPLGQGQYLYADSIQLSANDPAISLSEWKSSSTPIIEYDTTFKENRKIIKQAPTISLKATKQKSSQPAQASLRLVYYTNKTKNAIENLFPLSFKTQQPQPATEQPELKTEPTQETLIPAQQCAAPITQKQPSWLDYLKNVATKSNLLWVRLLIAFLLGLLFSLTPCIYPMIPITIGIIQAQGSSSFGRNFSLALAYTMGISTTYALLGLAAAIAGQAFGSIMNNPIVILLIIALLIYSALSLFGLYEIRMPRLFKGQTTSKGGSFLAAFLFGAASGTIASPCLSPGLFFMLTLVTTFKSIWIGFILLFTFAIGLSVPLLIVGTFSGALNMLPRAGSWMIEIKYLCGIMLLGMCFYFLNNIVSLPMLLILLAIFLFISGVFYLFHAKKISGSCWQTISNVLGMLFIALSVFIAFRALQALYIPSKNQCSSEQWISDYSQAIKQAKCLSKPIFIFVHAPRCSACDEIGEHLKSEHARAALAHVVAIQIDLSKEDDPSTKAIVTTFKILGAPVCILVNPENQQAINRWDGELDAIQFEEMISLLSRQ
jgi:thiol:disulfide interchange protein DsbD